MDNSTAEFRVNHSMRMIVRIVITLFAAGLISESIYLHRPRTKFEVRVRQVEPLLTEVDLVNTGKGDGPANVNVLVSWQSGSLQAAAALADFQQANAGTNGVSFIAGNSSKAPVLHPGEMRAIGWVRLSEDSPIQAVIQPAR